MNWKWMVAVVVALLVGLLMAPLGHKTVLAASPVSASSHFQIQEAIADESNGDGQDVPTHEVFLLDTESGKVWRFQGLVWGHDKDGTAKMFTEPTFFPVSIAQPNK